MPDYGIPYLGSQVAAVPRQNFYGFKSDYLKTGTDIVTLTAEHDFMEGVTVSNKLRYAAYSQNFRFTEPLIATTVPATTPLQRCHRHPQRQFRHQHPNHAVGPGGRGGAFRHRIGQAYGRRRDRGRARNRQARIRQQLGRAVGAAAGARSGPCPSPPPAPSRASRPIPSPTVSPAYVMDTIKLGPPMGVHWRRSLGLFRYCIYRDQNFSTTTPGLVTPAMTM